jgi:hypothetical protein
MKTEHPTIATLKSGTREFFSRHWDRRRLGPAPTWSSAWEFLGGIPNNDRPGCYVLLQGEDVVYIGSAVGKGKARYPNSGLGGRLQAYCSRDFSVKASDVASRRYKPTATANGVTALATIGFETKHWYLATALELFLIDRLRPKRNRVGRRWQA